MRAHLLSIFLLFLLVLAGMGAKAQNAEIRGFLYNDDDKQPLIFSNVLLQGTKFGTSSDVNGFYSLSRLPAGTYTVVVTSIGFDTIRMEVTLKANERRTENFYLKETAFSLQTVDVSANQIDKSTVVNAGVNKISPRQINLVPSFGGEADLAQYLQTIPGIIFTGDQGGQLYIRGGTPVQTLVLMDGMIVYNPFHSIGLFSVFDTDLIRNVDVYTGGYSAEYGGRTSAVMDVTTRDGSKKRFGGVASVSPFSSKLLLEGPLGTPKPGVAGTSFIINSRYSYLDKTAPKLYEYANNGSLPFSFWDTYGKVTLSGKTGSRVSFFGFNFTDQARLGNTAQVNWDSFGFGSSFVILPSQSSVMMDGTFAYSKYDIGIQETTARDRTSSISGFNFNMNFTYYLQKNELKYGFDLIGNTTDFLGYSLLGSEQREKNNNTELAGYLRYRIVKPRFVLEPSLRMHFYASLSTISPEPRLGFKYNLTDRIRLKAATGLFSQNFISTRSDRDVVNLFAGFLSTPDYLEDAYGNRVENRLQQAAHLITGLELDLTDNLTVNIEPYVKQFTQLTNINRNRVENRDPKYIVEEGLAKGIDLQVVLHVRRFMLQTGYSLAKVDRTFGDLVYPTNFDRRHNVNLLSTYQFGHENRWEASARWNLGSGFPFTPTAGFYEYLNPGSMGIDFDYTTANGELGILYGRLNAARLPYYHRFDVQVERKFRLGPNTVFELTGAVTNVYNRRNIFYFDRVSSSRIDQLPILPSINATLRF